MDLIPAPHRPNPAAVYLSMLGEISRQSMVSQLRGIAYRLSGNDDIEEFPWHTIDKMAAVVVIEMMRKEGRTPSTINHALTAMRRVSEEAFYLGQVGREHYENVKRVRRLRGRRQSQATTPTRAQVRRAVQAALAGHSLKDLRDATLIATLAGTGIRKSEAIGCVTSDYAAGRLKVLGKGDLEAWQPVSPDARMLISEYLAEVPAGPLFPAWKKNDHPSADHLSASGFDKVLNRWLPGVTPHRLRHAYATWLAEDGHSLPVIQRLMRHSSPTQTMTYIHNVEAQIAASEALRF